MKLGQLTEAGLSLFSEYLTQARVDASIDPPYSLLSDAEGSVVLPEYVVVDPARKFSSRFACAVYLHDTLDSLPPEAERDVGMWAWLSLLYFEQLCPTTKSGHRKVGEQARYVPAPNAFQRFYRHLLLGPYLIYGSHRHDPDAARAVLANPLNSPGDIVEQLASRQELVSNPAVMGVASRLYVDAKGSLKRGAGSKGPGSPRRLADIFNQFDLTYDLYAMSDLELLELLPAEFDRFKQAVPS